MQPLSIVTVAMSPLEKRFIGSKVHGFGLVPFTVILTDRFDKVLRVLRFFECASYRLSILAMLYELCIAPSFLTPHS